MSVAVSTSSLRRRLRLRRDRHDRRLRHPESTTAGGHPQGEAMTAHRRRQHHVRGKQFMEAVKRRSRRGDIIVTGAGFSRHLQGGEGSQRPHLSSSPPEFGKLAERTARTRSSWRRRSGRAPGGRPAAAGNCSLMVRKVGEEGPLDPSRRVPTGYESRNDGEISGADAVQWPRALLLYEGSLCPALPKQTYLDARKEDVVLMKSPGGGCPGARSATRSWSAGSAAGRLRRECPLWVPEELQPQLLIIDRLRHVAQRGHGGRARLPPWENVLEDQGPPERAS